MSGWRSAVLDTLRETLRARWRAVHPALVITRREIRDTLRDWRLVLPIVILVIGFPILANFTASRGLGFVRRYGADLIMERLYPFLMLVVGFFPTTFSLVIALETFVGEKERRSLEPLLATPLTDAQLYFGKLLAAVTPPVIASWLGMLSYVLLLGFTLGWWPSVGLIILAFGLSTVEGIVMVSGAVIVSSQSTSVRAANLVASFIIIPMALLLQVEAWMLLFANYAALWMIALALLIVDVLLVRLGIRIFNREQLLGQVIDRLDLKHALRTFWQALWPSDGIGALYRREIPRVVRGARAEVIVTLIVMIVGGAAVGGWAARTLPLPPEAFSLSELADPNPGSISELVQETGLLPTFSTGAVFWNNVRSLIAAAGLALVSLGILALLLLLAPMAIVVYLGLQVGDLGVNPLLFVILGVLPHGLLELPAAILATAQAMRMGDVLLAPPSRGGGITGVIREIGHFLKLFVALVLPLLLIAAWIEVNVTPRLFLAFLASVS
jgi:uncharacterized membrane protein SpoIIM required for sporulation/ABC-type transport system involved in multi-copper enzyme maturation permease subunit